jgi:hypothetical protein
MLQGNAAGISCCQLETEAGKVHSFDIWSTTPCSNELHCHTADVAPTAQGLRTGGIQQ